MEALSKQIEEAILDGINTYKELAAIGRGFDITSFSKICANQIVFEKECKHCHKSKLIENGVCNCCGGEQSSNP